MFKFGSGKRGPRSAALAKLKTPFFPVRAINSCNKKTRKSTQELPFYPKFHGTRKFSPLKILADRLPKDFPSPDSGHYFTEESLIHYSFRSPLSLLCTIYGVKGLASATEALCKL